MKKEKLLRRLSALQFAMWEMHVYLDTHPGCPEEFALYKEYREKFEAVRKEYEDQFGPLTLSGNNSDEWLQNPWPWDVDFATKE